MKVLFVGKKGLGEFFVEFKPIADNWLTWKAGISKDMKLIHEECYYKIALGQADELPYIESGEVCTLCGGEAPENVTKFIGLTNKLKDYVT